MDLFIEILRRGRQSFATFLGIVVVAYFCYHLFQGQRGVFAWMRLNSEVSKAEKYLEVVKAERTVLEKRVSLLYPDKMDPDMLDERARLMLGFARPDEVIVVLPQ